MTDATNKAQCSFCGVEKSPEVPLISGNNGMICEGCVSLAHQVVSSWGRKKQCATMINSLKTPLEIKEHLDGYVIGQDEAKETLSVAVYTHYLRLLNQGDDEQDLNADTGAELEKSNVLMAGPSGTGKTLLVKSLARIIGVPIVIADATTLTQAGYVGDDVDSVLQRLLEAADGDVNRAEWGIVYIDEIDKLARTSNGAAAVRDVSGEGVQQALLKMVEGSQVKLTKGDKRRGGEEVMIDTTNILFIVGGAFPGLDKIVSERIQPSKRSIGFSASNMVSESSKKSNNELLAMMSPEDFQMFGIIPEFIGRFPIITFLQELDIDALLRILQEPKNALVRQYRQLFKYQGVKLEFTDAALRRIAQKALDRGTGARGLRGIMESVLRKTMFDLPSKTGISTCIVDEKEVNDAAEFIVEEILGSSEEMEHNHASHSHDDDSEMVLSNKN
ncbi:ATP-dependent Clp protease ATP-binding subunit ClpX [Halioxenophilus sp. WMMB6]|uniref:ATP-dependent Clp protease ATP-binding subunit ClpX n=1 Tax=Halioxenophilus sp. WMMB6 TaxID=3073815 RepID=UPI00295F5171|nr:ATP-dependent Clp protease ATP-binding subunit ClpX [Halioxenophilus sp. WMMB6]